MIQVDHEGERVGTPPIEHLKAVLGLSGARSDSSIEKHIPLINGQYLIATYRSPTSGWGEELRIKVYERERQGIALSFTKDGLVAVSFLMMDFSVGEKKVAIESLNLSLRDVYDVDKEHYQKLTDPIADWLEGVIKKGQIDELPFKVSLRGRAAHEVPDSQE